MNFDTVTAKNLIHSTDLFDVEMKVNENESYILMVVKSNHFDTQQLPQTFDILNTAFPRVLKTNCVNTLGLPFCEEVKNTELGHLFEHILIAYLCDIREKNGCEKCFYSGVTNWDWLEDEKGTFHISMSTTKKDLDILSMALQKTVNLTSSILMSSADINVENKAAVL